jgi:superfamily I DNA/RNA helicase
MTIHQAKNREFDNVLVLWPVQVPSDPEAQRRLLYNALTRAKNLATVIVQDPAPAKSRLTVPPFSMASTA